MTDHAMSGDRPTFPNHVRDLAPELARIAVFVIAIGPAPEDKREPHEATVAGCEGDRCAIPSADPPLGGEGRQVGGGLREAANG
jgi:hypothetical protein